MLHKHLCNMKIQIESPPPVVDARQAHKSPWSYEEEGHDRVIAPRNSRCLVCALEHRWKPKDVGTGGLRNNICTCTKCGVCAHSCIQTDTEERGYFIHSIDEFKGKSCFAIMHTALGKEIWRRSNGRNSCRVREYHPVVLELRRKHGIGPPSKQRKRKRKNDSLLEQEATGLEQASQVCTAAAYDSSGDDIYV